MAEGGGGGLAGGFEEDHAGDVVDGVVEEDGVAGVGVQLPVVGVGEGEMTTSAGVRRPTVWGRRGWWWGVWWCGGRG